MLIYTFPQHLEKGLPAPKFSHQALTSLVCGSYSRCWCLRSSSLGSKAETQLTRLKHKWILENKAETCNQDVGK